MPKDLRRIREYELQKPLGHGSVSEVWKAYDTQLKRSVALKLLHPDLQADPDFTRRFKREMPVISSLHYPNIVQILDYSLSRPRESNYLGAYIVMNYVRGRTLADYIRTTSRAGRFPSAADVVHLFTVVGEAIDYAHEHGVIHADIKPGNILLDKEYILRNLMGEPMLVDFGIAKMLATGTAEFNSQPGTSLYISPEQATYYPAANELSDIYSLGVILYELCTGKLPFEGESTSDSAMQDINSVPPSPASINPNISPAVADVILSSLARNPARRFPSASEMARALACALDVPVPKSLNLFISLPVNPGPSTQLLPASPMEQVEPHTSPPSPEGMDEPAFQKAAWSPPTAWWSPPESPPATTTHSAADHPRLPQSRKPGKSVKPAVEGPVSTPEPPLASRFWKLGSIRPFARKQAPRKPAASVLEKDRPGPAGAVAGKASNVPVVDDPKGGGKQRMQGRRRKARKRYFVACALLLLLLFTSGSLFSLVEYQAYSAKYHADMSLAREGIQHLQRGLALFEALQHNPLDAPTVQSAQLEFTASSRVFSQLNSQLKSLPELTLSLPGYGARLRAALHLLPIAIEVSQSGVIACNTLDLLISRFHGPSHTRAAGLMKADLSVIGQNFQHIKALLNLVTGQVDRLQPEDLQLDPGLHKLVAAFHKDIPALQSQLDVAEKILPPAPTIFGIGTPTNYLIEVLDSTQLSPGGGFVDGYGTATFSGGQLTAARITDVDLLDDPFEAAGGQIPLPASYTWFDQASTWSFRDSNLDADFPTAARYAEQNYALEGGKAPVQGVIAVTPAFIAHAVALTGPIDVPEFHETITVQNMAARIHYYHFGPGKQENYSRPHRFMEVLAAHFLAHLRQLSQSALLKFWQEVLSSLQSKDVQIYLNSSAAEHLFQSYHLDAAIQTAGSDSLFVVDANISSNQVNSLISNTLNDRVTIDGKGNAVHHTTLRYDWVQQGQNDGSPFYRDYLRVYAPPGSALQAQDGWQPRGRSEAFKREVWAGFFTLSPGQTHTITLVWTVPGAAKKGPGGWDYHFTIQRQAGARWALHLQITLPSCAGRVTRLEGFPPGSSRALALAQSLNADMHVGVDYTC